MNSKLRQLAEKIQPEFNETIVLYLFSDEETKIDYVFHHGPGWAPGMNILVEVFNEEQRLDPYHSCLSCPRLLKS